MTHTMDTDAALTARSSSFSMTDLLEAMHLLTRGGPGECNLPFFFCSNIMLLRDHAYTGWTRQQSRAI